MLGSNASSCPIKRKAASATAEVDDCLRSSQAERT